MMSNVITFPEPKPSKARHRAAGTGSVTLFVHIRRTTLIAHLTGRVSAAAARNEREVGQS